MAKKNKTAWFCANCGNEEPKWVGKCPACGEWNTFKEAALPSSTTNLHTPSGNTNQPLPITKIESKADKRISTGSTEFDRVLGTGLVTGSLVLIGGEPGIGKSTLMLQIALKLANTKVLYVSGEESASQIKLRAERIGGENSECLIVSETSLQNIQVHLKNTQPNLVVIDSIQTLQADGVESSPGSITQIRECTNQLLRFAKETDTPVILIGHITKDGSIAGPKVLEHMVDVVLQFEGDTNYMYRIIRGIKNRFGSTSEIGIFEMQQAGLREVSNPSELLLAQFDDTLSGTAVAASTEGVRPLLLEIQALVSTAAYGTPQRSVTGYDLRRLNMLLAVLEKRAGFRLGAKDVFLNIAGGIRVDDPATDLAVAAAVLSSDQDIAIPKKSCFAGEIGLSGEVRPVSRLEQRISEAEKLGFTEIFVSKYNKIAERERFRIHIMEVGNINDLFRLLFG